MHSDIQIPTPLFHATAADPSTPRVNSAVLDMCNRNVRWWEVGAAEYRALVAAGETPFPPPVTLPDTAVSALHVPSSHGAFQVPCRVIRPAAPKVGRGVFLHFHCGGFVFGSAAEQDPLLEHIANECGLVVVSVEYRLAPEHPFPAGPDDCVDVAAWLLGNAREEFGCELLFLGGESAGATLASLVLLSLRKSSQHQRILGTVLNYGCYDLTLLPSVHESSTATAPLLGFDDCVNYVAAYVGTMDFEKCKDGRVSPAYNSLQNLGSALFLVGTEDALLDDTVLMHFRWAKAGNEAIVRFVPGACHSFLLFPTTLPCVQQGFSIIVEYIVEKLMSMEKEQGDTILGTDI